MSNNLPVGWGDRNNKMSEKDINLGGVAATKFGGRAKTDGETGIIKFRKRH